jgi:hypothetical protein
LTVFEHLWFYARLKGRDPEIVLDETARMIDDLVRSALAGGAQPRELELSWERAFPVVTL